MKELAFRDDFRAQPALVLLVFEQQAAVRLEARAHSHDPIGAVRRARSSAERRRRAPKTKSLQGKKSHAQ